MPSRLTHGLAHPQAFDDTNAAASFLSSVANALSPGRSVKFNDGQASITISNSIQGSPGTAIQPTAIAGTSTVPGTPAVMAGGAAPVSNTPSAGTPAAVNPAGAPPAAAKPTRVGGNAGTGHGGGGKDGGPHVPSGDRLMIDPASAFLPKMKPKVAKRKNPLSDKDSDVPSEDDSAAPSRGRAKRCLIAERPRPRARGPVAVNYNEDATFDQMGLTDEVLCQRIGGNDMVASAMPQPTHSSTPSLDRLADAANDFEQDAIGITHSTVPTTGEANAAAAPCVAAEAVIIPITVPANGPHLISMLIPAALPADDAAGAAGRAAAADVIVIDADVDYGDGPLPGVRPGAPHHIEDDSA